MAKVIFICTVYNPFEFYQRTSINDRSVDTFVQLARRIGLTIRFDYDKIYEVTPVRKTEGLNENYYYKGHVEHLNTYVSDTSDVSFSLMELDEYNKKEDNEKTVVYRPKQNNG